VVNPGAEDFDREVAWMERKVEAGARFFQTQAVYDPWAFERFMTRAAYLRVPVLATYVVPRSGEMARRINRSVPGVRVPQAIIDRLDAASDKAACAIEVSAPILRELAAMSQGLHLIAVSWESRFQALLAAAGIEREATSQAPIGGGEHAG
jgi:5,10-methylenetetrahydrofolate reductase